MLLFENVFMRGKKGLRDNLIWRKKVLEAVWLVEGLFIRRRLKGCSPISQGEELEEIDFHFGAKLEAGEGERCFKEDC